MAKTAGIPVHTYPTLLGGTLVKRYKRFFADIQLDSGEIVTAHCPNTGPMTGVSAIGSPVYVSRSLDPKRKLKFTWEMIEVQGIWVGINTAMPNKIIRILLERHLLPDLEPYDTIQSEVAYGSENSRIDFLLTHGAVKRYVEVKNTTWHDGTTALFPDTVTTRGQKHLRELMAAIAPQTKSTIIYFINRSDCHTFQASATADPHYAKLLAQAQHHGVQILPCRFQISPQTVEFLGMADFKTGD